MMNMVFRREMPTANVIQEMYPLSEEMRERKRKNDEEIRDIPVIVMTTDQDAELECLNLGVMDFVSKPYPKAEIIRSQVNKCI